MMPHKNRILLVDDEPNVTQALKRSLRRDPYDLFSATSAAQGLALLAEHDIDVVISDEMMQGMSGSEFLATVRREYPATIRMILTGQASLAAAIRAINEGEVYRFFTKPCNDQDLRITIRQALQQRDLAQQSRQLLQRFHAQAAAIEDLERENPGISCVKTDESGAIVVDEEVDDVEELLTRIDAALDAGERRTP